MSEISFAENIAGIVLNRIGEDPDSELCILARQFLRAREQIAALEAGLDSLADRAFSEVMRARTLVHTSRRTGQTAKLKKVDLPTVAESS